MITVLANDGKTGESTELSYTNYKVIGNGSFGVVFQAKLIENGEYAAIKKVLQDKRFKVISHLLDLSKKESRITNHETCITSQYSRSQGLFLF